jgi:hypothetical protein
MDSVQFYHDIDVIASYVREWLLFLFDEIVKLREFDPSAKKKARTVVPDEVVRQRIMKLRVVSLPVILQLNNFDCGLHAHSTLFELISRFIEWHESSDDAIRYSHFINYWNPTYSFSPQQIVAKRIEFYAMVLKFSIAYFYYGEFDDKLSAYIRSPGIQELVTVFKQTVMTLETQFRDINDDYFILHNPNNGIGLDRDSDDVNNLLRTPKQSWSSHFVNLVFINGEFRLFFKYDTTGLHEAFSGAEYVRSKNPGYWNEWPWIHEDYGLLFWYIIFGAIESNGNVWFSKCPIINKQTGEIFYLARTTITMCTSPVARWFILPMSKISLITIDEENMKLFESKPSAQFLGSDNFEYHTMMNFKALDMTYDPDNPHIKGRHRASTADAYTEKENLLALDRLNPNDPIDVHHIMAEWLRDPARQKAFKLLLEQSGSVFSPVTMTLKKKKDDAPVEVTVNRRMQPSRKIKNNNSDDAQVVEEEIVDESQIMSPEPPKSSKKRDQKKMLLSDKVVVEPSNDDEGITPPIDEYDHNDNFECNLPTPSDPDYYKDYTIERLKTLLESDGIPYKKNWPKKQLIEA